MRSFKQIVDAQAPVQILGVINAYCAMLAQEAGAQVIYLSGAGVANASYGLPDLGMTNLTDVMEDVRRIRNACALPLLVDIDTGWGHELCIMRTVKSMESAGVAAIHIEDQVFAKRCGHRDRKEIISTEKMCDRIKAAVDARSNSDFVIMARTDSYALEGMQGALDRAHAYVGVGADMIFPEALATLEEYKQFTQNVAVPIMANITEFGKTPLFTRDELQKVGVKLILYPLSAFRAMSEAALLVYRSIINDGTQANIINTMQTRQKLYDVLHYEAFEKMMDQIKE